MKQGWVVRAERGGRLYDAFKENAVIAIGWAGIGPLSNLKTRDKIAACVATTWSRRLTSGWRRTNRPPQWNAAR